MTLDKSIPADMTKHNTRQDLFGSHEKTWQWTGSYRLIWRNTTLNRIIPADMTKYDTEQDHTGWHDETRHWTGSYRLTWRNTTLSRIIPADMTKHDTEQDHTGWHETGQDHSGLLCCREEGRGDQRRGVWRRGVPHLPDPGQLRRGGRQWAVHEGRAGEAAEGHLHPPAGHADWHRECTRVVPVTTESDPPPPHPPTSVAELVLLWVTWCNRRSLVSL